MGDYPIEGHSWLRTNLCTLIIAVAFAMALIVVGITLNKQYAMTTLSESVTAFNEENKIELARTHQPPITEEEIVNAIESQLPTLDATEQVKAIYKSIAATRQLPPGTTFSSFSVSGRGERPTLWCINLEVMTGPNSGYGLRIRETNELAARK